jgi:hypothetical protein
MREDIASSTMQAIISGDGSTLDGSFVADKVDESCLGCHDMLYAPYRVQSTTKSVNSVVSFHK